MFVSSNAQNVEWTAIPTTALRMTNIQILTETLEKRCSGKTGKSPEHDYTVKKKKDQQQHQQQLVENSAASSIEIMETCDVSDNTHHVTISADGTVELESPRNKKSKKETADNVQEACENIPLTIEANNKSNKRKGSLLPEWWLEFQKKNKERRSQQCKHHHKPSDNEEQPTQDEAPATPETNNTVQEVLDEPLCAEGEDEEVSRTYLPDWWEEFQKLKDEKKKEDGERKKARIRNKQGQEEMASGDKPAVAQESSSDMQEEMSEDEEDVLLYMEDFLPEWWSEFQTKCIENKKQNKQHPLNNEQNKQSPKRKEEAPEVKKNNTSVLEAEGDLNMHELKTKLKDLEYENTILRKENEAFRKMIIELEEENELLRESILT